jgi:hypothetical protein
MVHQKQSNVEPLILSVATYNKEIGDWILD